MRKFSIHIAIIASLTLIGCKGRPEVNITENERNPADRSDNNQALLDQLEAEKKARQELEKELKEKSKKKASRGLRIDSWL